MPLDERCSLDAYRSNVAQEIRAGRDPDQAAAIAHETLRNACRRAQQPTPKLDAIDKGTNVLRYDAGEFSRPVETPNGYLRCDARITKVGVFPYRLKDGSIRRELRLPEEVFRDDALSSFEDVPLTNNHPREKLTAKNTRKWQAGNVKRVQKDDRYVAARVLITDADTIEAAKAGKNQLSCGYTCDLDFEAGTTRGIEGVPDGLKYDAIQRNIIGNHVAIVDRGRAGTDATLHLDADDAVQVDETSEPTGPAPGPVGGRKMKIDGIDFEMGDQAAQAVAKMVERLDSADKSVTELRAQLAKAEARADKAEEDLAAEKKARADDASDTKVQELVRARVALETAAGEVLKEDDLDLSTMAEVDIRKAVVLKMSPDAKDKLDAADSSYLAARYDAAVEAWKKSGSLPAGPDKPRTKTVTTVKTDSMSARERMIQHNQSLGRSPIVASQPAT